MAPSRTCWLRYWRESQAMSQGELARRAGIHRVTLNRLENGRAMPSLEHALALAGELRADVEHLWVAAIDESTAAEELLVRSADGVLPEALLNHVAMSYVERGYPVPPEFAPFRETGRWS